MGNGVKVISKSHKDSTNIQHIKIYYENGELEKQYTLIDDLKNGIEKVFYKSSNIQSLYNYTAGEFNGEQRKYFDSNNNNIKEILNYEFGQIIGNQYKFYDGNKIEQHGIVNPKNQVFNKVTYDENTNQTKIHSLTFKAFGDFDKKIYKVGDTIKYRAFIFKPNNYEIKYLSSFYKNEIPIRLSEKKINNDIVNQSLILSEKEKYRLVEKIEIIDKMNDTTYIENYSLIISPNTDFTNL